MCTEPVSQSNSSVLKDYIALSTCEGHQVQAKFTINHTSSLFLRCRFGSFSTPLGPALLFRLFRYRSSRRSRRRTSTMYPESAILQRVRDNGTRSRSKFMLFRVPAAGCQRPSLPNSQAGDEPGRIDHFRRPFVCQQGRS